MKKVLILLMVLFLMTSCNLLKKEDELIQENDKLVEIVKIGSASITEVKGIELNDEDIGGFNFSTVFTILALDQDNKIVKLKLDVVDTKTTFNKEGVIKPINQEILSKANLKDNDYTQLEILENYALNKTVNELLSIKIEDGKIIEEELKNLITIDISVYLKAVAKAFNNLKTVSGVDKIGIGQFTKTSIKEADAEKNASFAVNSNLAFIAIDVKGQLVYVNFDVAQSSGGLKKDMTTTVSENIKTKKEKGNDYKMAEHSSIGKEWFEQVEALENYILNKTVDVAVSMELVENNGQHIPQTEELKTSVTIGVDTQLVSLVEAFKNLK